jgi:hypothetical protein
MALHCDAAPSGFPKRGISYVASPFDNLPADMPSHYANVVPEDFVWTTGGLPSIVHISMLALGAFGEVHKVRNLCLFVIEMLTELPKMKNIVTNDVFRDRKAANIDRFSHEN